MSTAIKTNQKMRFDKDLFGKEILYRGKDLPVTMEWEKPYLEACIEALAPSGDVLEIGFGLGYAANKIEQFHPKSHTIIESSPEVVAKAKEWAKGFKNVKVIEGSWQEVLPSLGLFDAIFFDNYLPCNQAEVNYAIEHNKILQNLAEEAETLRSDLATVLKSFKGIKFSDAQLTDFKKHLLSLPHVPKKQLHQFLESLQTQGNITEEQRKNFCRSLENTSLAEQEKKPPTLLEMNAKVLSHGFIDFAAQVFESHLKPKGRLSGAIGESKKGPFEEFQKRVLSRSDVIYHENIFPVTVPKNCPYFQGNSASIILLTKK